MAIAVAREEGCVRGGQLPAVGGPQPGQDELEVKPAPRTKDSVEPVFYHSLPGSFYLEVFKVFPVGAIVDMTAGEGCLARAAYQLNIRYVGVTFNEAHEAGLRTRLEGK